MVHVISLSAVRIALSESSARLIGFGLKTRAHLALSQRAFI